MKNEKWRTLSLLGEAVEEALTAAAIPYRPFMTAPGLYQTRYRQLEVPDNYFAAAEQLIATIERAAAEAALEQCGATEPASDRAVRSLGNDPYREPDGASPAELLARDDAWMAAHVSSAAKPRLVDFATGYIALGIVIVGVVVAATVMMRSVF